MNNNNNAIELRQFNAVSIRQLEDICKNIILSVDSMNSITPKTSIESVMYAAGANYAINRLLSFVKASNNMKG